MGSSEANTTRIVWSTFSNGIPSHLKNQGGYEQTFVKHNVEVVFWCQGHRQENMLHYFFPMRHSGAVEKKHEKWIPLMQARYPDMKAPERVISYVIDHFHLLMECIQPDLFISWNRYDPTFGLPYMLAKERGIACFDMERALIPRFLSLGLNFREESVPFNEDEKRTGLDLLKEFPSSHIYSHYSGRFKRPSSPADFVLILGSWDAVVDSSEAIYSDSDEMARQLAKAMPDRQFVYKPHPLSSPVVRDCPNLEISNADPLKLIKSSEAVVTSGSKLELDVLLARKPLILAGRGFLYGTEAPRITNSHDQLVEALSDLGQWHDSENSLMELAGYCGRKSQTDWYSFSENEPHALSLDKLLVKLIQGNPDPKQKPALQDSLMRYFSRFGNRYHRSGMADIGGWELLREVVARAKRKLKSPVWM